MPKVKDEYREEVKTRVILAALDVFSRCGYHDTKMDDIAEKAAVSKGTLYNQFSGKEDLFRGITEYLFRQEMDCCDVLITEEDPVKSFGVMFGEITKLYEGKESFLFEIFSTMFRDVKMREIMTEAFLKEIEGFAQIITAMQSEGKIRQDIDPRSFSILIMALFMGIFTSRMIFGKDMVPERELMDTGLKSVLFEK